jgi:hypothetical protein
VCTVLALVVNKTYASSLATVTNDSPELSCTGSHLLVVCSGFAGGACRSEVVLSKVAMLLVFID